MTTRSIQTSSQFEEWLVEHNWLLDCRVLSLAPLPRSPQEPLPTAVSMELAYQIEGNYEAHSIRVSRKFRFLATGIREYRLADEGGISPNHWSQGMDLLVPDDGIAFRIDLPAFLFLRCDEIFIEELPNLVERVEPWLSDHTVFARVPAVSIPTPAEWVALFKRHNEEVVWHIYREQPKPTLEVPQANYRGWFLQDPTCLDDEHQGLFFFSCNPDNEGFSVCVENSGASDRLWHVTKTILGQFKDVAIHCGNCIFSGQEWVKQLQTESTTP